MQGLGVHRAAAPAQGCCGKSWHQCWGTLPVHCPVCTKMLTAPALGLSCSAIWVLLMSETRGWETSLHRRHSWHGLTALLKDSDRPGYELWQFQLRESNPIKYKEKRTQTLSRLFKRQDFTLFLSVILHPDSFQLQPSQTSLRSEMAAFSKATRSNFLKMQQAFCPLSVVWLPLGPPLFLKRFSSAHLELRGALQGKEYVYGKCKNKYLPEFIFSNRAGKLFKTNNNNKESSQEIME